MSVFLKFEALLLSEFSDENKEHFLSRLSHLILGNTLQGGTHFTKEKAEITEFGQGSTDSRW